VRIAVHAQELPALLDLVDRGAGLLGDLRQLVHRQVVEVVLDDRRVSGRHEGHVVELHQQAVAQVARADADRLEVAHDLDGLLASGIGTSSCWAICSAVSARRPSSSSE
jgi:hypothetical protein